MSLITGGYIYDFIPDVPLNYICVSCNLPLKKPHQISICGHRVCLQCFQNIKQESEARYEELICPFDDEIINGGKVYPDIAVEKELLNWNVKCENHINNCLWVGPLKEIEEHQVLCKKDTSENNVLESEFISKADFEMVVLKLHSLQSRIEAYESKVAYCEQKMEVSNTELASCKATLSEKCKQMATIQSELDMLKSLLVDGNDKSFGRFDVECETECNDTIPSGECSVINSNESEQNMSANSTKSKYTNDMTLIYQDKSSDENKTLVINREGKTNIDNTANKELAESNTISSDSKNHNSQTYFHETDLGKKKSDWYFVIVKNKEKSESCTPKPQTDEIGSINNLVDVESKKADPMNTANIMSNVVNQIYLWQPKHILRWQQSKIKLFSPQFNHKDFQFQFKINNTKDNIIFSFLHSRNQVLPGCKCAVVFLSKSGKNRPFTFDLSDAKEKRKTFSGIEFTKYFMDVETKIYFQILE